MISLETSSSAASAVSSSIRVAIADDYAIVRIGLTSALSQQHDIEVCGQARDGDEALALMQRQPADVLLLDTHMPGLPCIEFLQQLSKQSRPPRVLLLVDQIEIETAMLMLKSGASGCMLKAEDPLMIIDAVRALACGETWISPNLMTTIVNFMLHNPVKPLLDSLSQREIEILQQLSAGKGNTCISKALNISPRTVRFHLRNMCDKLNMSRTEVMAWGIQHSNSVSSATRPRGVDLQKTS